MASRLSLLLLLAVAATVGVASGEPSSDLVKGKFLDRLVVVVLENADYEQVLQNEYFHDLVVRPGSRLLSNYHAADAASAQANYLSMISGATHDAADGKAYYFNAKTIIDQLEREGISWGAYVEGFPGNCSNVTAADYHYIFWPSYVREHNPFMSFASIVEDSARCAKIVNAAILDEDIEDKEVPQVVFHIPNLFNNGHYYGVIGAANWLQGWLEPKLNSSHFMKNTAILVTFNKAASDTKQVFSLLLGEAVAHKSNDTLPYSHYSILATIEDNWGLSSLTDDDRKARSFHGLNIPGRGSPPPHRSHPPPHKHKPHHHDDDDDKKHHHDDDDDKKHHGDDDDDDKKHHDDDGGVVMVASE